jgi:hypothetical protein
MKNFIFILLGFLSFTNHAQVDIKLQYGPSASLDWSYRSLKIANGYDGIYESIIFDRDQKEKFAPRATVGFDFGLLFGDHFSMGTAVHYSNKGYQHKNTYTTFFQYVVDGVTYVEEISSVDVNAWINYHYIDIPITIGYQFNLGERNGLKFQLGYINNLYLTSSYRAWFNYENGTKEKNYDSNRELSNYSAQGMGGIYFQWKPGQMETPIEIGPQFKFSILSIVDSPIHERLYSVGLRATWYLR